jgi:hypothetical protein
MFRFYRPLLGERPRWWSRNLLRLGPYDCCEAQLEFLNNFDWALLLHFFRDEFVMKSVKSPIYCGSAYGSRITAKCFIRFCPAVLYGYDAFVRSRQMSA